MVVLNDGEILAEIVALFICISFISLSLYFYVKCCSAAHVPVPFSVYIFFGILLVGVTVYVLFEIITEILWG